MDPHSSQPNLAFVKNENSSTDRDAASLGATGSPRGSNAHTSLPSFVELMASLGLHDEHSAHALLRGAAAPDTTDSFDVEDPSSTIGATKAAQDGDNSGVTAAKERNDKYHSNRSSTSNASISGLSGSLAAGLESPTPTSSFNIAQGTPFSGTPLSSASLLTPPLVSPPIYPTQRDRHNSHGKKRYSPYGLGASTTNLNEYSRDIYARRGSVPGTSTEMNAHTFLPSLHHHDSTNSKRQLHHLSAPLESVNYHHQKQSLQASTLSRLHGFPSSEDVAQLGDPTPTNTDDDGDEEMQDATETNKSDQAATSYQALPSGITGNAMTLSTTHHSDSNDKDHKGRVQTQSMGHCAGQPNLLISRQRIAQTPSSSRPFAGPTRTKSSSHLRTTSADIRSSGMPPLPGASNLDSSETSSKRKGNSPYSSVGRRSGKTMSTSSHNNQQQPQHGTSFIELGLDNEADISVVSISSLLRRSHPVAPGGSPNMTLPSIDKTTGSSPESKPSTTHLLPPKSFLTTPPSAPPTKTTFGFLPSHGSLGDNLISGNRRGRHARSSSARSVREMIREREGLGSTLSAAAGLHSFHPLGGKQESSTGPTRKRLLGNHNAASGAAGMSVSEESEGENSQNADANKASSQRKMNLVLPNLTGSALLPLDDPSRSFAHRRKNKRRLGASDTNENGGSSSRSSPPPPLMLLPTLPLNFNIKALVPPSTENSNGSGGEEKSGYVSRREPHSPDPRNSQWRTRRSTPPGVAGAAAAATRCGVVS
ncbi:hypothetical protein CPB86DRAFT_206766 [Serendipita vermifera]|nr:hypothetical protein CPB86DRAFT_206766 [Serendipita vermifera]